MREALARSRIEPDPDWVHMGAFDNKSFVRSLVAGSRPDAFICANDHTAALLLRALRQNDVYVRKDVRVVGFDDVSFDTLVSSALTTARQPCNELASPPFTQCSTAKQNRTCPLAT